MKYIIKIDVFQDKDVILDNTYIKSMSTIPTDFSWYTDKPKHISTLKISRHVIRLLKSSRYKHIIKKIYPEPIDTSYEI